MDTLHSLGNQGEDNGTKIKNKNLSFSIWLQDKDIQLWINKKQFGVAAPLAHHLGIQTYKSVIKHILTQIAVQISLCAIIMATTKTLLVAHNYSVALKTGISESESGKSTNSHLNDTNLYNLFSIF